MAQSNAERQRRYRQRLKALAADGSNAVRKLNDAYNAAAAEQRDEALAEIRHKIAESKDQNFVRAMQDMIDRLPPPSYRWTVDDWRRIARLLGKADEASTVAEAEQEALRRFRKLKPPMKLKRPWSPFRHVVVAPQKDTHKFSDRLYCPGREESRDKAHPAADVPAAPSPELV